MKVYIAGPIAGYKDGNRAAFEMYAEVLAERGHDVVNPHDVDHSHEGQPCRGTEVPRHIADIDLFVDNVDELHRYGCYMKADLIALIECDAALFLPGWKDSKGAKVERSVADILGMDIIEYWQIEEVTG